MQQMIAHNTKQIESLDSQMKKRENGNKLQEAFTQKYPTQEVTEAFEQKLANLTLQLSLIHI